MTELLSFKESNFPELANSEVESLSTTLLYYVFTGRNAWHSTWITRYSEGCMHASLELAKKYAENRRTQGTVFHIKELPSIIVRSKNGCLIVTQINSNNPLSNYSPNATSVDTKLGTKKIDGALNNYICKKAPVLGVALSFAYDSRFWLKPPTATNSVIAVATNDPSAIFPELPDRDLITKVSVSHGGNYLLGWSDKKSLINKTGVRSILSDTT
ncbi:hypothetical protein VUJ49_23245 [Pseudomonas berkeleyensis]|uniref:Uncharacterized protein n=1 Tax=Pseudomonas berkeleyensis TaxID=2726956 RepID=A0A7G5DMA5_9PSED|nr:hypothetical protein [Pseudomonas berkeleyensis]QMV62880.1 hypothetical protein HS968_23150 [Pseudomonas berkeleyensis]WSO38334.1 hypothetical protein VUJ49_23245 [Pseudomonas berkeleyensis]